MDLTQNKLTRTEWDSIEVPVSDSEKDILRMIIDGFTNQDIVKNKTMSLFSFTKIEYSKENIIVSVGRFTNRGHAKRQDIIIKAFIELSISTSSRGSIIICIIIIRSSGSSGSSSSSSSSSSSNTTNYY
jgi:hypothetical protein